MKKKGGIQSGNNSHVVGMAATLDKHCKSIMQTALEDGAPVKKGVPKEDIPGYEEGVYSSACEADGGVWYDADGNIVAAFEMKVANGRDPSAGNAHERFFMNWSIVKHLNPSARYVVFICGPGSIRREDKGLTSGYSMFPCFVTALALEGKVTVNKLYDTGLSVFQREEGFSEEEIRYVMQSAIGDIYEL